MTNVLNDRSVVSTGDSEVVLALRGVSKSYPLYASRTDMVLDRLGTPRFLLREIHDFHALRDVNLTVRKGERIGIVGKNGAGKSTMLKLITGNFRPTTGEVEVSGTVQALMQAGLGFNSAASGYENIRSSLSFNGLEGLGFEAAVNDVAEFVELGEFLHQPISTYSQGMLARLQFATATAIKPDIMIVDEVMGAGDAYFSAKCARRMYDLTRFGCSLLLVSHSPQQIIQYCDRAIWLHNGRVHYQDTAQRVVAAYEVYMERLSQAAMTGTRVDDVSIDEEVLTPLADGKNVYRWPGRPGLQISGFSVTSEQKEANEIRPGAQLQVELLLDVQEAGRYGCIYYVGFWTREGYRACRTESPIDFFDAEAPLLRKVRVDLSPFPLGEGEYVISLSIYDRLNFSTTTAGTLCRFDTLMRCYELKVVDDRQVRAQSYPVANWKFAEAV